MDDLVRHPLIEPHLDQALRARLETMPRDLNRESSLNREALKLQHL